MKWTRWAQGFCIAILVLFLGLLSAAQAGGKMYWTDNLTDKIQRANLDGTGPEDLVTGLSGPRPGR